MITIIEGKPGAGKSYLANADHLVGALVKTDKKKEQVEKTKFSNLIDSILAFLPKKNKKEDVFKGRYIITNLPLNLEYLEKEGFDISFIKLLKKDFQYKPFQKINDYTDYSDLMVDGKGPLYIVDEAHEVLPKVGRTDERYRDIEHFFSMHRHYFSDVVLITQSFKKLNPNVFELTDEFKQLVNLKLLGSLFRNKFRVVFKDGPLKSDITLAKQVRKYNKEYFNYYNSHTLAKQKGAESGIQDQKSIYRNWKVYIGVAFIIWSIFNLFDKKPWEIFDKTSTVKTQEKTSSEQKTETSNVVVDAETRARNEALQQAEAQAELKRMEERREEEKRLSCGHFLKNFNISFAYHLIDEETGFNELYYNVRHPNSQKSVISKSFLESKGYYFMNEYFDENERYFLKADPTRFQIKITRGLYNYSNYAVNIKNHKCDYYNYSVSHIKHKAEENSLRAGDRETAGSAAQSSTTKNIFGDGLQTLFKE